MALTWFRSNGLLEDVGDLVVLVSVPFLVVISALALFGFTTLAALASIILVFVVLPVTLLSGDSVLSSNAESVSDPVSELRERYVAGELSEDEFERAIDRHLSTPDRDDVSKPDWNRQLDERTKAMESDRDRVLDDERR
ncbi:SHOCT domain-containing protein [Halovivax gelatinilyticus]|uniref:SHOCT domain-containing protein n=1 Tax=Halovivax gelatinilyticus TaxID=2961597 RepID=UPI0020CA6083|nr:SHOCT domain-containing protein [Halovivax gelatinilyticus]